MGTHMGVPLPFIIQWFKTMTTNEYIRKVKSAGWPPFERRLLQRNYYEHITRNEDDLSAVRQYIISNPVNWTKDELYS
jgi:REP element-mobilizing transposase RayT